MNYTAAQGVCPMYRTQFDPSEIPADIRQYFEEVEVPCGAPWRRVVERARGGPTGREARRPVPTSSNGNHNSMGKVDGSDTRGLPSVTSETLGWAPSCTCAAGDPIPATVLDPFSGAGTTVLVAERLGRRGIGVELKPSYADMAKRRLVADAPLFSAEVLR